MVSKGDVKNDLFEDWHRCHHQLNESATRMNDLLGEQKGDQLAKVGDLRLESAASIRQNPDKNMKSRQNDLLEDCCSPQLKRQEATTNFHLWQEWAKDSRQQRNKSVERQDSLLDDSSVDLKEEEHMLLPLAKEQQQPEFNAFKHFHVNLDSNLDENEHANPLPPFGGSDCGPSFTQLARFRSSTYYREL